MGEPPSTVIVTSPSDWLKHVASSIVKSVTISSLGS